MGKAKDPPHFSLEKPYNQWKTEIKAWMFSADTADQNKAALTIALSLPEKGCNSIRTRIFNKITFFVPGTLADPAEKISPTAWKDMIDFMDKEFAKDDISELYDKTDEFLHTAKDDEETMKDYLNRFDDAMNQAEKAGMGELSQGFKMCLFLKNAKLDQKDFKFVVSDIDYKTKATLYQQAKDSMIKYFGSIGSQKSSEGAVGGGAFDIDTLWNRNGGRQGGYGRSRGGGYGGGRSFRDNRNQEEVGQRVESKHEGNIFGKNQPKTFRKLNPKKFGKILKCHNCQAITHLANECPEANVTLIGESEDLDIIMAMNQEKKEDEEDDDYVDRIVKSIGTDHRDTDTHYNMCWVVTTEEAEADKEEVQVMVQEDDKKGQLGEGVLDTGCISTVGPRKWMNKRIENMSKESRRMMKVKPSNRTFRFGGGVKAKSLGLYTIPVNVGGKNTFLDVDIVDAPIPLLISKAAMKKAGAVIDTRDDTILIFDTKVSLKTVTAGHYALDLEDWKHEDKAVAEVLQVNADIIEEEDDEDVEKAIEAMEGMEFEILSVWSEDSDELKRQLIKVHDQMGHPSIKVFRRMIKISEGFNKNVDTMINKLYEDCVTCFRHGKGKIRPKVCTPISQEVNSTVAMDLKLWPRFNTIILYMTCLFSRFTHGVIIPNKKPETVVKAFMEEWILGFFGTPKDAVLFDNGGEFCNKSMKTLCEKLNIKMMTTGALSPWSNGIVERNHGVVDSIIKRMKEDKPTASMKELLKSALFTKNMMVNKEGFSSYQIVTGNQPRIPGVPYNDPPANEEETSSEAVKRTMNNMFLSREKYMKAENDTRIKKALNSKIPAPKLEKYEEGEEVWYRHGNERWEGPASVIGQSNKVIFLRQGRFILAASQTNVKKRYPKEEEEKRKEEEKKMKEEKRMKELQKMVKRSKEKEEDKNEQENSDSDDSSDEEKELTDEEESSQSQDTNEADADESDELAQPDSAQTVSPRLSLDQAQAQAEMPGTPGAAREQMVLPSLEQSGGEESDDEDEDFRNEVKRRYHQTSPQLHKKREPEPPKPFVFDEMPKPKLTRGTVIYARKRSERDNPNAWEKFIIKIKTHKRVKYGDTKHYGPHWNVTDINGHDLGWYEDAWDWHIEGQERPDKIANYVKQDVEIRIRAPHQKEEEEETFVVFIPKHKHKLDFVKKAKEKELENFKNYEAYEEVPDIGQERISMSWIIAEKLYGDGTKGCKARLVAHGNQLHNSVPKDSPTARKTTLRLTTSLCVQYGWKMHNCDVTAAFLQSTHMLREVCVLPPKDVPRSRGTLWRLTRPCYGLPEASMCWFLTVNKDLKERGMKEIMMDPAAYYWAPEGKLKGIYVSHVDDAYYCGDEDFHVMIMKPLFEKFKMGQIMEGDFRSLGWNVKTNDRKEITVSQKDYIESKVEKLNILKKKDQLVSSALTDDQTAKLRAKIGMLRWLADQTRPDVAHSCLVLNTKQLAPTWREVKLFNATVDKVLRQPVDILYRRLEPSKWYVTVFCDASHGALNNGNDSCGGYLIFLSNGYKQGHRNIANLLAWKSTKIKRVCRSSTAAETMVLASAMEEGDLIREQIVTMTGMSEDLCILEVYCDSKNALDNLQASTPPDSIKAYRHEYALIQRLLEETNARLELISGVEQLADSLTKLGASEVDLIETVNKGKFFN